MDFVIDHVLNKKASSKFLVFVEGERRSERSIKPSIVGSKLVQGKPELVVYVLYDRGT